MNFSEILPKAVIPKLVQTIKIWFGTPNQHIKIVQALANYRQEIESKGTTVESLAFAIEKTVQEANDAKEKKQKLPVRVRVKSGDGQREIGEGSYVGNVKVYFIEMPDGSLRSAPDAEQKPDIIPHGGILHETDGNPKIILDNGTVVYGCQVWWEEIPPERDVLPMHEKVPEEAYKYN